MHEDYNFFMEKRGFFIILVLIIAATFFASSFQSDLSGNSVLRSTSTPEGSCICPQSSFSNPCTSSERVDSVSFFNNCNAGTSQNQCTGIKQGCGAMYRCVNVNTGVSTPRPSSVPCNWR